MRQKRTRIFAPVSRANCAPTSASRRAAHRIAASAEKDSSCWPTANPASSRPNRTAVPGRTIPALKSASTPDWPSSARAIPVSSWPTIRKLAQVKLEFHFSPCPPLVSNLAHTKKMSTSVCSAWTTATSFCKFASTSRADLRARIVLEYPVLDQDQVEEVNHHPAQLKTALAVSSSTPNRASATVSPIGKSI